MYGKIDMKDVENNLTRLVSHENNREKDLVRLGIIGS